MKLSNFTYGKKDFINESLSLGIPFSCPTNHNTSKVYGQCGIGVGCSGGGGQCGIGVGCSGGGGQCGIGVGCSGGGGQCGIGVGCSGW